MAAADAPQALGHAVPGAILANGEDHVLAASRLVDTQGWQDRPDELLVQAHHANDERREQSANHVASAEGAGASASRAIFFTACLTSLGSDVRKASSVYISCGRGMRTRS